MRGRFTTAVTGQASTAGRAAGRPFPSWPCTNTGGSRSERSEESEDPPQADRSSARVRIAKRDGDAGETARARGWQSARQSEDHRALHGESPRDCSRLQSLRGRGHEQAKAVFSRGTGAGSPIGALTTSMSILPSGRPSARSRRRSGARQKPSGSGSGKRRRTRETARV
jgi:hypothetical protein